MQTIIFCSMEDAPRDGTLVDLVFDSIRFVDCYFDRQRNVWAREHGYPSSLQVFFNSPDGWLPRPMGLVKPYETNEAGRKYIP